MLGAAAWWASEGAAPVPAYETELGEAATEFGEAATEFGETATELGEAAAELGQAATELGEAATEFSEEYDGGARDNDEVGDHHDGERGRTQLLPRPHPGLDRHQRKPGHQRRKAVLDTAGNW